MRVVPPGCKTEVMPAEGKERQWPEFPPPPPSHPGLLKGALVPQLAFLLVMFTLFGREEVI